LSGIAGLHELHQCAVAFAIHSPSLINTDQSPKGYSNRATFRSGLMVQVFTFTWWTWLILGGVLMAAELLLPTGFFLFFFGVGAALTGGLVALGLLPSFTLQGLVFVGISLASIVLLRKPLLAKFHFRNKSHVSVDTLIGQTAKALDSMAPQAVGKVELRGSCWSALNVGSDSIALDARCRVEKVEGLTLHVRI
jgi:inner membrane protein